VCQRQKLKEFERKYMDNENHTSDATDDDSEENFAQLLEKSLTTRGRLEPGQKVESKIVKITPEWIFLDLGGKGEGYLDRKELMDAAGELAVKEGDMIRAYFLSSENNEMRFTTKIGSGPAGRQQIEDAWRNDIPVEGTIVKEVKGGFEIKIAGSIRAFCPFSLAGIRREDDSSAHIGRSTTFKITEYNEKNIILSRKAILEEERDRKKQELKSTLKEGMKVKGTITSIQKFGAFVDIGGVEGLLPISEIGWGRTDKVSDVLSMDQEVEVVIKAADWGENRFSFSLKDVMPNPWDRVADDYPVGSYHIGTVARLVPFGVFVTLGKGVDGLIHISKLGAGKKISHPKEVLKEGQKVEVKIEAVDKEKKKLSLSLAEISREEEEAAATLKNYQEQAKDKPQNLGNLGDLLKAKMEQKGRSN
jgi:small subunit ribosomal protein S1